MAAATWIDLLPQTIPSPASAKAGKKAVQTAGMPDAFWMKKFTKPIEESPTAAIK